PGPRFSHASALINDKLYVMGGFVPGNSELPINSDFFFLDVTEIPLSKPSTDLSHLTVTSTCWATAVAGGRDGSQFIIFGGHNGSLILAFDTTTSTWLQPTILGIPPIRRKKTQAVIDSSGKMYIFGGSTDYPVLKFFNDMIILDTISWSWNVEVFNNSPSPRDSFTAVILPSGIIVYIGGSSSDGYYIPMEQIHTFDTLSLSWSSMNATGTIPSSRCGASSVLTTDGRVFVFGGSIRVTDDIYEEAYPNLAVLDTTKTPYEWSTPRTTNTAPPSLSWHSSTLVNDIIIIAFGNITNYGPSSEIYMLDTRSYTWITSGPAFSLSYQMVKRSNNDTSSSSSPISTSGIVGIAIGAAFFGILIALFTIVLFYRRYKRKKARNATDSSTSSSQVLTTPNAISNNSNLIPSNQQYLKTPTSNNNNLILSNQQYPKTPTPKPQLPPQKHIIQYQFVPDPNPSLNTPYNSQPVAVIPSSGSSYHQYSPQSQYYPAPQPQSSLVMPTFQPSPVQQSLSVPLPPPSPFPSTSSQYHQSSPQRSPRISPQSSTSFQQPPVMPHFQ
ncbi:13114_t:CDS:2, partial [Acaulospora morrowiae]